ncbi:hypothetical protein ACH79_42490 [Bradyrhizobium sp. CCBAU 051011]|uniref:hypothetical protein n=1 Tax=Bradyrhizobium sp. CCBAU 051011 TaxID=858422 RepID=UPI0013739DD4|nr:hypothetical protein [Bradyrhizobium sp. CCBAU 051011]QHO78270.1 hypothetical protein ACH79_42490 [Bradyrhizobium sp. CCBAU 051011]
MTADTLGGTLGVGGFLEGLGRLRQATKKVRLPGDWNVNDDFGHLAISVKPQALLVSSSAGDFSRAKLEILTAPKETVRTRAVPRVREHGGCLL